MTAIDLAAAFAPDVEYLDLGSSKGGSLRFGKTLASPGARGLGIDLDPRKVEQARAANLDVVVGDATQLGLTNAVRFITMFDFLEHLPGRDAVKAAIASAAQAATDFIYIRHPSFEGKDALHRLGLRQYWWNWHGHTSHHTVADYRAIFAELGLTDYVIEFREQVLDSAHHSIQSVDAPLDAFQFDPSQHPPKPYVRFSEPIWMGQRVWVFLRPFSVEEFSRLIARG